MKKTKKISKSFIGFLIASVFIWFLITLSKEYTATLSFLVKYNNIPQNKLLQKEPLKEIDIVVKSTGFNLVRSRFKKKIIQLNASSLNRKSTNKYYFLTKNQISAIQKQLYSGVELEEVIQDSIFLDLGSLVSKKVKVVPNLDIKYHIGYDISESIVVKPDSILISGPESQIELLKSIYLDLLKLEDVKANFSHDVKIKKATNFNSIKIATETVNISGEVEKYTEGSFEIPFKVINLPEDVKLTMLNQTVEVVFVVGLSNFNKIDKSFFEVTCDYNTSKENNLNYLLPKVVAKSSLLKSYKVVPNKIDFLIQK